MQLGFPLYQQLLPSQSYAIKGLPFFLKKPCKKWKHTASVEVETSKEEVMKCE